jgi:hypothetical protein
MRSLAFLAAAALTVLVSTASAEDLGKGLSPPARRGLQPPPEAVMCGPNSLYMLLKVYDRPVSSSAFFRDMKPGAAGMSLTQLRDASVRLGLPAEVRRCTYEQLVGECRLPLIALLHPWLEMAGQNEGHYVLVVDANSEGVTIIDGTSGGRDHFLPEAFCREWKGYVVMPSRGQWDWRALLALSVAGWVLFGGWILRAHGRGTRSRQPFDRSRGPDECKHDAIG